MPLTNYGSTYDAPPQADGSPAPVPQAPSADDEAKAKAQADAQAAQAAQQQAIDNHFNYGGYQGAAGQASDYFLNQANGAQARQGEQINYGAAQGYNAQAQQDAGSQAGIANLMAQRANGSMPSIAQMQADRQMGQATAAQSSMAASARGPAGLALAQQGAAANTAGLQSNISNQAQINGAQEQQANTQAAMSAYSGMRGQDLQGMSQQSQMAQAQASMNAQQRAQNDQYSQSMYGNQLNVNNAQLNAQQNQMAQANGLQMQQNQLAQNADFQSQNRTDKYTGAVLGAAGTVGGVLLSGFMGGTGTSGAKNNVSGVGSGDGGDSGYGAPGSTPGGYDSETGAPMAGTGGGYDPNNPDGLQDGSDIRMKQNIRGMGEAAAMQQSMGGDQVVPLAEDPNSGMERHWDADVPKAAAAPDMMSGASLSGPAPKYSSATPDTPPPAPKLSLAAAAAKTRKLSPAELERLGREMQGSVNTQKDAQLRAGPAVDPMGHALEHGLKPFEYEYKPGFAEQERQTQGEKNVGPMAQNMASNPITGSAVKQAPNGLLMMDMPKTTKLNSAGIGYLAAKQRKLEEDMAALKEEGG